MPTRRLIACCLAALSLTLAACGEEETDRAGDGSSAQTQPTETAPGSGAAASRDKPKIPKPQGEPPKRLVVEDLIEGDGATARTGSHLTVNYVGVSHSDGEEFDSSYDSGQPFQFELGASMVIPGWEEGLQGMKVGGRRKLTIPPDKAYGAQGSPPAIGPNETLVFVIDLLAAR